MDALRVMMFYDGAYFKQGQVFFRYGPDKRGWFDLQRLHSFLEQYVADKAKRSREITKVVSAHYYNGRATTNVADSLQLEKDRDFEMALMKVGIIPHYLPVAETARENGQGEMSYKLAQKGVDVELAIDVLDAAHQDRYDVAVLVTGDGDFVPLVRRITSLSKHAVVAHFEIEPWKDEQGRSQKRTFCSQALIDAASWSLNFNQMVRDRDRKDEVKSLFFMPNQTRKARAGT
jgi:uncharacterized LabA/DUF88 family protein